jgi:hypothetical protein
VRYYRRPPDVAPADVISGCALSVVMPSDALPDDLNALRVLAGLLSSEGDAAIAESRQHSVSTAASLSGRFNRGWRQAA